MSVGEGDRNPVELLSEEFLARIRRGEAVTPEEYALKHPELADEILSMRQRMECSRAERDLKRGFGGVVDVEFLVQLFQLKYGRERPALRTPNTWDALDALMTASLLSEEDHATLRTGYDFLLRVQSRLRIVHNRSLDAVPGDARAVEKLARRLGYDSGAKFIAELERHTAQTREGFLRLVERERNG